MFKTSWAWLVLVALVGGVASISAPARAAEDRDDAGRRGDRRRRGDWRRRFTAMREALQKRRDGKELTKEEKETLQRFDRFRGAAGDPGRVADRPDDPFAAPARGKTGIGELRRFRHDERLNVIDDAYYRIAEIHVQEKVYDQAVESLRQLIKKSPDKLAVSLTHFNLAELYRKELNNKKEAIAEYKKVTGEYAIEAQRRLASLFEELEQIDEAVATFEAIVKTTLDKMQKVLALRELAELLFRNERKDEAVAVLQRLTRAVTYDEAPKITKELQAAGERQEKVAEQERDRARAARMQQFRDRFRRREPRRPDGDRELRPDRARPREPAAKDAEPRERPIHPK